MSILVTFPGKHGDCLWALPTVRAISETYGEPVTLQISQTIGSLAPLLKRQSYLAEVIVDADWCLQDTAPVSPRRPPWILWTGDGHAARYTDTEPGPYDRIVHLGYEGWPTPNLPLDVYNRANRFNTLTDLDLTRPWITPTYALHPTDLCVGFTDEHFELKYGLYFLLHDRFCMRSVHKTVSLSTSPRWQREANYLGFDWCSAAAWLASTKVFLGCCSALHVLACAVGTPVIMMEPNPQRHNDVFYPYGKRGPQVQLVLGGDGQPTWDSRHVGDAVEEALALLKKE